MQLWKLKAKRVFDLAKHGLTKTWDLRPKIGLQIERKLWRRKGEEKERRRRRGRGRGRKEIKQAKIKRYGTTWAFKALNGFPCNCMVISCLQPRVLLGFHPNPIIIKSKVDKTIKSTRSI